jgi:hypothetical protein
MQRRENQSLSLETQHGPEQPSWVVFPRTGELRDTPRSPTGPFRLASSQRKRKIWATLVL